MLSLSFSNICSVFTVSVCANILRMEKDGRLSSKRTNETIFTIGREIELKLERPIVIVCLFTNISYFIYCL